MSDRSVAFIDSLDRRVTDTAATCTACGACASACPTLAVAGIDGSDTQALTSRRPGYPARWRGAGGSFRAMVQDVLWLGRLSDRLPRRHQPSFHADYGASCAYSGKSRTRTQGRR